MSVHLPSGLLMNMFHRFNFDLGSRGLNVRSLEGETLKYQLLYKIHEIIENNLLNI